ncbi:hypothetical protein AX16_008215, partial [Volvariella volvacea WC 439]
MSLTADGLCRMAEECGGKASDMSDLLRFAMQSAYHNLYHEVWTNEKWPFIREEVVRHNPLKSIQVPSEVHAFAPWESCRTMFQILRCRPFVRDEYHVVLADIIECRKRGVSVFHRPLDGGMGQQTVQSGNQADLAGTQNPTQHDALFPNPFAQDHDGPALTGVSILGQSGIGKTTFLFFILLLRLHAKMPTLLMIEPDTVTLFLSGGVFDLPLTYLSLADRIIPQDVWCLVSNRLVDDVPEPIVWCCSGVIIQTTSLHPHRLEWVKKTERVYRYFMHPFSLPELIIGWGRGLKEPKVDQNAVERRLQEYHENYTPSARNAWNMVKDPQGFRDMIHRDVWNMKFQELSDSFWRQEFNFMNNDFSDRIFTVKVGGERGDYVIDMQPHIVHLLVEAFYVHERKEAVDLFEIFYWREEIRGVAGRFLDYMLHSLLLRKSHWPVRHLKRYRWTASQPYPELVPDTFEDTFVSRTDPCLLRRGGKAQADANEPSDLVPGHFPCSKHDQDRAQCVQQRGVIFRSDTQSKTAFDGFLFPTDDWAIVFQVPVYRRCTANQLGFRALRDLGIKKVWYAVIVPQGQSVDIPITAPQDDEMIEEAFVLELSEAAICRGKAPEGS